MNIIWLSLFAATFTAFFARYFAVTYVGRWQAPVVRPNLVLVFVTITILALVSGLRNNIGDTFLYMHAYRITDFRTEFKLEGDFGFSLLQILLQSISRDPQILVFVTACVTMLFIGLAFKQHARLFELAIFVFITSGMYITSMNGIRQFLASSIIFISSKYLFEGKWRLFIPIALVAFTIHNTALIFIPIYFLVRRRAWTRSTFLALLFAVVIVIGFNTFQNALFTVLEDTHYSVYSSFDEGGAHLIRVIVYAVPLIIAFLGREKLRQINPNSDYIVNLTLLGLVFMIISTQNWIFARFAIYFGLYQVVLLTWIVKLFREKDQRFIYYAIIIFYLMFCYYENVMVLGIQYKSSYIPSF